MDIIIDGDIDRLKRELISSNYASWEIECETCTIYSQPHNNVCESCEEECHKVFRLKGLEKKDKIKMIEIAYKSKNLEMIKFVEKITGLSLQYGGSWLKELEFLIIYGEAVSYSIIDLQLRGKC